MTENTYEKLRKAQLKILKDFIAICEKLNLQYFAVCGTAIGAIRHQGYIPWDDDIDVAMLKEDYDKFIAEAPKLLPKYLFLQTIDTEPNYPLIVYAKLRDSRTTFIESSVAHINMNHGIYIDIFPCYYIPENNIARYWHYFCRRLLIIRLGTEVNRTSVHIKKGKFITRVLQFILKKVYPNSRIVQNKLHNLFRSVPLTSCVTLPGIAWGVHGMERKWFEEISKHKFEDIEINLPIEYDKCLRKEYGDYMQLPPIEQQCPHHYADIVATDRPYTEYV